MAKCRHCNKNEGIYPHFDGGKVCDGCVGAHFTCPGCGGIFDRNDFENGDQVTGFCKDCSPNR